MTTKVYVLAHERFTWEGFWSEVIGVYNTKSYAVEQMFAAEMNWCDENPHDAEEWECTETNDDMVRHEHPQTSDYVEWSVVEKEIEIDPECQYDRNGNVLNVGDRVLWYDPSEEFRDLQRVYKIFDIDGDIIRISDERSEVECPASELELYKP